MPLITSPKLKAAFVDRDGVINEERNYVHRVEDFVFLPRVAQGLRLLSEAGYLLIIVTNQAGIARGYYKLSHLKILHEYMQQQLALQGVKLDAIYFCPHHPQGIVKKYSIECDCRKPKTGLLLQAKLDFGLDLSKSVLIGDKITDIQSGKNAGLYRTVLVESGHSFEVNACIQSDYIASDLLAAVQWLTAG